MLALALATFLLVGAGGHGAEEAAGATAASAWLTLVDDARYGKSWAEAAPVVRQTVSEVKWEEALDAVRIPLGRMHTRRVLSAHYVDSPPDGRYVVIEYETSFDTRGAAVETVMVELDPHGVWRVSRYYVR